MSNYYSYEKKLEYLEIGAQNEDQAMKLLIDTYGGRCFKSYDLQVDKICHTDFFWETNKGILCSIDKKMMKQVARKWNGGFSARSTWLELVGNEGYPGSACCHAQDLQSFGYPVSKEHDYLMIETPKKMLFIQRYKTEELLTLNMEGKEIVYKNPRAEYIPYQRKDFGHKDICMLVPFKDLEKISHFTINIPNQ